jgi:hypothetical protein
MNGQEIRKWQPECCKYRVEYIIQKCNPPTSSTELVSLKNIFKHSPFSDICKNLGYSSLKDVLEDFEKYNRLPLELTSTSQLKDRIIDNKYYANICILKI